MYFCWSIFAKKITFSLDYKRGSLEPHLQEDSRYADNLLTIMLLKTLGMISGLKAHLEIIVYLSSMSEW